MNRSNGNNRNHVRRQWHRAGHDKRQECYACVTEGGRLFLRQVLCLEHALVRADGKVVAHCHRQSVGEEVCCANDEDHAQREAATGHASNDRKGGDDAVVSAINQLTDVVSGNFERALRLDVQRLSVHRE